MSRFKNVINFFKSLKFRLILFLILFGIVPGIVLKVGIVKTYEDRSVSIKTSEILSQAKILANQIVSNDYLNYPNSTIINAELDQLSNIYDGRVMVIDNEFHIIKDTYDLDTNKTIISKEVIESYYGQEIKKYDAENRYIELTVPLSRPVEQTGATEVLGVMLVSVSTDSINLNMEYLARNAYVIQLICAVAAVFLAVILSIQLVKPFHKMSKSIDEIKTGYGEDALSVNDYTETIEICKKFNEMLGRMKVLDDSRQEFVSNVSHELKTPIALIQGYAEGLKEGINDDPESTEFYCNVIIDEAGKMNRMVKNLLILNQLEFGSDEVEFERFDIVKLVKGVIASCDILIQQAEANIDFIAGESAYVWADEFKTEQVVRNYLTNAIHHAENEKRIEVKIIRTEGKVRVSVFNSGKPIPEEDIPKLWDKFYKVDKAHTREYGGNGIGLSIVKAIMESFHQGYGVKNYDNGVEFWFELDAKCGKV